MNTKYTYSTSTIKKISILLMFKKLITPERLHQKRFMVYIKDNVTRRYTQR